MSGKGKGVALPRAVALVLREFINALGKATMYPAGHRFVADAATSLAAQLAVLEQERGALTLGILPRGLLLDGAAVEPLASVLREFASRLHRKNIGTIHIALGVTVGEVSGMLAALAAPDAAETVGRAGWRSAAIRVEPLVYDVLGYGDASYEHELDEAFWGELVEAAFGRRLSEHDGVPTPAQMAEEISVRVARSPEEARRVFEALVSFSSAIASRGERGAGGARKRFTEVLSALSRPTQVRVMEAAPTIPTRRRFLADTLQIVPPSLLLQLLEAAGIADGAPLSSVLRGLLGKLAVGPDGMPTATPGFTAQVLSMLAQWDGGDELSPTEATDPRMVLEPIATVALGLELALPAAPVLAAARQAAARGQLLDILALIDDPANDRTTTDAIAAAVLDPDLLRRLLATPTPDFVLVARVAAMSPAAAVPVLLDALERAENRSARRRLLDLIVELGPLVEETLLSRLDAAPWYLARNILVVLSQLPAVHDPQPVLRALRAADPRVRQEALKVLLRHPETRDRAVTDVLEEGDAAQSRIALAALGGRCPPSLVAPVLAVLGHENAELQLHAVRLLADSVSPLVVPQLLNLVRARGGFFRRVRLLPATPVRVAALEILARRWSNHRPVVAVLQLAAKSTDAQVRAAVEGHA